MGIEQNIKRSFQDVKMEMISLKNDILQLAESQKELADLIHKLEKAKKGKTVKKKVSKKRK